jgi:hypothetical protein
MLGVHSWSIACWAIRGRLAPFRALKVDFFTRAKAQYLVRVLTERFGDPSRLDLLEVGCGIGNLHPFLAKVVRTITGDLPLDLRSSQGSRRGEAVCRGRGLMASLEYWPIRGLD